MDSTNQPQPSPATEPADLLLPESWGLTRPLKGVLQQMEDSGPQKSAKILHEEFTKLLKSKLGDRVDFAEGKVQIDKQGSRLKIAFVIEGTIL